MVDTTLTELDHREADGISVTLLFDAGTRETLIVLSDARTDLCESMKVAPENAADAFQHPFCYLDRSLVLA